VRFHKSGKRFQVSICAGPSESSVQANFYEKALFVKPTWRPSVVAERNGFECPSRYASIRTFSESTLW
jgi:hypothetical protein